MISRKLWFVLFCLLLVAIDANGQNLDVIRIIPRQGIVINSDSILWDKITIEKICSLYNLKRDTTKFHIENSDWLDPKTDKMVGMSMSYEEFQYRSIIFKFYTIPSSTEKVLGYIEITDPTKYEILTCNGYSLSGPNPKIQEYYPFVKRWDHYSSDMLTISMNSYRLWISLKKNRDNELRISNISMRLNGKIKND
jgi:hypothetical protein